MGSSKRGRVKEAEKAKKETAEKKDEKKKETKPVQQRAARTLIRILNTDLDGEKNLITALRGIRGVSYTMSKAICTVGSFNPGQKLSSLSETDIQKIEQIIRSPTNFGIPLFLINRRRDPATSENLHLTGQDLVVSRKFDIQDEINMKTYRGWRHMLGQPVRGQRTRSKFRHKGGAVGVLRKDAKMQQAPKEGAAPAAAKTTEAAKPAEVKAKEEKKTEQKKE